MTNYNNKLRIRKLKIMNYWEEQKREIKMILNIRKKLIDLKH